MQFQDDLAAGIVLVRPALRSPNYQPGSAGWSVNLDGSSEFNDVVVRGTIASSNFVSGSAGWQLLNTGHAEFNDVTIRGGTTLGGSAYYYNGTPGAGNLIMSVSSAAGTDPYGNAVVAGLGVYGTTDRVTVKSTTGATAVLRADAPSGISDTPAPGLALSMASGDNAPGSLTEFDDTFSRGVYLRSPSPVADPSASEGSDYASIRMLGRFHGGDPSIDLEANGPTSTIAFNGTILDSTGEITTYAGSNWHTYTPVMANTGGATWSTRQGFWRRVGDFVWFNAYFVFSGAGTGGSPVSVTAPTSIDRTSRQFAIAHLEQVTTGSAGTGTAIAFQSGSGDVFDRIRNPSNTSMNGGDFTASSIVIVQGWYREG